MPTHFTQQPHDPEREPAVRPLYPVSAILWIPLALLFGAGMVVASKFGHERALEELDAVPSLGAANESGSAEFMIAPGDDPLVLAADPNSLRDHLSIPPGAPGSETLLVSKPVQAKVVSRDAELVQIEITSGELTGQRLWISKNRLPPGAAN